jgi:hypothetical protein
MYTKSDAEKFSTMADFISVGVVEEFMEKGTIKERENGVQKILLQGSTSRNNVQEVSHLEATELYLRQYRYHDTIINHRDNHQRTTISKIYH